jgi:hypothetical protein
MKQATVKNQAPQSGKIIIMPHSITILKCQALKNKCLLLYHAKAINHIAVSLSSKIA